jgi:hypothetical protein
MDSNFRVKIDVDITNLNERLKAVEQVLGKFKKSTDDASAGMAKMNNEAGRGRLVAFAFGQVIRDAGFFANDFGLGLLAISNNIPILIDQLVMMSNVSKGLGVALSLAGSVITAALTVVAYTMMYTKKATEDFYNELSKGTGEANKNALALNSLLSIAKDETLSLRQRQDAVNKINAEYKEFNGNLTVTGASSQKTSDLVDRLTKSMLLNAQATAIANEYSRLSAEMFKMQNTPLAEQAGLLDKATVYWRSFLDFINPFTGENNPIADFTKGAQAGLNKFGLKAFTSRTAELKNVMGTLESQLKGVYTQITALGLSNDKTKKSQTDLNKATEENLQLEANRFAIRLMGIKISQDAKEATDAETSSTQDLNDEIARGLYALDPIYQQTIEQTKELTESQKSANDSVRFLVQSIGSDLVNAFNSMLETGKMSFSGVIKAIGSMIKKLIAAVAAAALLSLILGSIFPGSTKVDFKSIFGMLSGLNTGGSTEFASGGIVYGPTNALIGEYAGARSNPEVVAPLDKLQSIIGNAGGGQMMPVIAETRVSGNDLSILIKRADRNRNGNY